MHLDNGCEKQWCQERSTAADLDLAKSSIILVYSDGGTRPECSASAWMLGIASAECDKGLKPMIVSGIYFQTPSSFFLAEAIALENATKELASFIRRVEDSKM